jgi:hypothetical protein
MDPEIVSTAMFRVLAKVIKFAGRYPDPLVDTDLTSEMDTEGVERCAAYFENTRKNFIEQIAKD